MCRDLQREPATTTEPFSTTEFFSTQFSTMSTNSPLTEFPPTEFPGTTEFTPFETTTFFGPGFGDCVGFLVDTPQGHLDYFYDNYDYNGTDPIGDYYYDYYGQEGTFHNGSCLLIGGGGCQTVIGGEFGVGGQRGLGPEYMYFSLR